MFCRHERQLHHISLSVYLSVDRSMRLSSNLSICLPIRLSLCLSLSLLYQSIYLSVCICLLIHLPVYLSTHVSVMPFIFISTQLHKGNTFTYFPNCLFVHLSIFVYIHLTIIIAKACRRATLVHQTTLSFSRERMCHVLLINYSFSCSLPESKPHRFVPLSQIIPRPLPISPATPPHSPALLTRLRDPPRCCSAPSTPGYCAAAELFSAVAHSSRGAR